MTGATPSPRRPTASCGTSCAAATEPRQRNTARGMALRMGSADPTENRTRIHEALRRGGGQMQAGCRIRRAALFFVFVTIGASGRGYAQIDLAGQWRPLLHEDIGHRLDEAAAAPGISGAGGPWIGDYTGLPINDAARFKAESWDPRIDSAREHQTIL